MTGINANDRGYAIGLGAGTQVLTHLPLLLFLDAIDQLTRGAGWVINLTVAEYGIRRGRTRPLQTPTAALRQP